MEYEKGRFERVMDWADPPDREMGDTLLSWLLPLIGLCAVLAGITVLLSALNIGAIFDAMREGNLLAIAAGFAFVAGMFWVLKD